MKHLKLYENKNDIIWVVVKTDHSAFFDEATEISIFDDMERARNYYIFLINELRKYYSTHEEMNNDVVTEKEADDCLEKINEGHFRYYLEYKSITSQGKYELPEEMKINSKSRKYNI